MSKKNWINIIFKIIMISLVLFLGFNKLNGYPRTWFDEGIHLLIAKNYALGNGYQFNAMVGPMVIVPIALFFKLFGVTLISARIVVVIYLILLILFFYLFTKWLINDYSALLACLFLMFIPSIDLFNWGRQILGEVPAFLFFIVGTYTWSKATFLNESNKKVLILLLSGLFFCLAILSKYQMLLIIPAWLLLWGINIILNNHINHKEFYLPLFSMSIIVILWLAIVQTNSAKEIQDYQNMLSRGILNISFARILSAGKLIINHGNFSGLFIPAVTIYAGFNGFALKNKKIVWQWLFVFCILWLSWFVLFSVGWQRYAFPVFSIGAIIISSFISDLTKDFLIFSIPLYKNRRKVFENFDYIKDYVIIGMLVCTFIYYSQVTFSEIRKFDDQGPQEMADYIKQNISNEELIETYEPEICFLAGSNCHLPPDYIMDISIYYMWYGGEPPKNIYSYIENNPDYLLLGGFGEWVDLYDMDFVNSNFELEKEISTYKLYKRN